MTGSLPITIEHDGDVERVVLHAPLADDAAGALRSCVLSLLERGFRVEVVSAYGGALSPATRRVLREASVEAA